MLRRQLQRVDGYDAVLVDCPRSLGLLTLNALVAASRLVVVTEPSFAALQGTEVLLDTYELVREHYSRELVLVRVIVKPVRADGRARRSTGGIERYFSDGVA